MEDIEELEITPKKDRKQHIWVEKYRPKKLEDYLGNDLIKETFKSYVAQQDFCHLLLYGGPGTGKCLGFDEEIDIEIDLTDDELNKLKDFMN